MTSRISLLAAGLSVGLAGGLAALPVSTPASAAQAPMAPAAGVKMRSVKVTNACLDSVPEPGTTEKVKICYTLIKPAQASKRKKVPLIMHSHGWGGSRTSNPTSFEAFTKAGYGILSFDQRGFGESGGHAHVENPDIEGHDVRALVKLISKLKWVKKDRPGDPRIGAIGGSYGGGYQFLGAFEEIRVKGRQVFDALAPQITWHDLKESLAPSGVVRTEWALALAAAGLPTDALPPEIYKALAEGAATGVWPDGSVPGTEDLDAFFLKNGPKWQISQGRKLTIPVLFGQGMTDTLFSTEQGLRNWRKALTRKARRNSIFVGYNGGHTLPAIYPQGTGVASDPCSKQLGGGNFEQLSIRFFNEQLKHRKAKRKLTGYNRIHLATRDSQCVTSRNAQPTKTFALGTVVAQTGPSGPAVATEVAQGPITVAGSSFLTAEVTSAALEGRTFIGLAVGTTPLDAQLVQNNVLPLREATPVVGLKRKITIPAAAVTVPAGKSLFLIFSPSSETFAGMSSRTPGVITLDNTVLHLPVQAK
ncbi:alpha/beta fold hydrolase [Nocardioides sp.]|uniref:alpha/beta fold hydrolase n=1 Tax=Nocardioides sp. TaxID=35761 RepID=UPI00356599BD